MDMGMTPADPALIPVTVGIPAKVMMGFEGVSYVQFTTPGDVSELSWHISPCFGEFEFLASPDADTMPAMEDDFDAVDLSFTDVVLDHSQESVTLEVEPNSTYTLALRSTCGYPAQVSVSVTTDLSAPASIVLPDDAKITLSQPAQLDCKQKLSEDGECGGIVTIEWTAIEDEDIEYQLYYHVGTDMHCGMVMGTVCGLETAEAMNTAMLSGMMMGKMMQLMMIEGEECPTCANSELPEMNMTEEMMMMMMQNMSPMIQLPPGGWSSATSVTLEGIKSLTGYHVEVLARRKSNNDEKVAYPPVFVKVECLDVVLQGDYNADSAVDILDVVSLVNAILIGPALTECQVKAMDMNTDNLLNILDVVDLIQQLLKAP